MGMKYQQEEQNRLLSETWLRRPAFRANKGIVCMTWNGPHRSSAVTKAAMSHVQGGADLQGFSRHPPSSKKKKKKKNKMRYEQTVHALDALFSQNIGKTHSLGIGPEWCL